MVVTMRWMPVGMLVGAMLGAGAAGAATTVQPENSGFAVSVIGAGKGMDREAFAQAVVAALPEDLLDHTRNFLSDEGHDPDKPYRIVIAFHDADAEVTPDLCAPDTPAARTAERSDPDFQSLQTAIGVAAALCEGETALSTSANRSVGRVQPGDMSFGFLVADTVKDLFPDGFAVLPRGRGDTERTFGSTVGTDAAE